MGLIRESITVGSMSYERGWPFSMIDQLRDLRYDVSQRGYVRGVPTWAWGQASRVGEVAKASSAEGREEARARRGSRGWNWNPLRGWHFSTGMGIPGMRPIATIAAFIWFYLRLFLLIYLIFMLVVAPPALAVGSLWILVTEAAFVLAGIGILAAGVGFAVIWWLQSSDAEARPAVS
jgi:hypothetical protein